MIITERRCMLQALAAASKTVDPSLQVHSFHSYFLRTGVDDGICFVTNLFPIVCFFFVWSFGSVF
jgi:hypothetical protein